MSISERLFLTNDGKKVIIQKPNWQAYVAVAILVVGFAWDEGHIQDYIIAAGAFVALHWAWLEFSEGVNLYRRILGVVVGLGSVYLLIMRIVAGI